MTSIRLIAQLTATVITVLLASCASHKDVAKTEQAKAEDKYVNPFPAGTYDHFKAEKKYPKTYDVWKNEEVYSRTDPSNSSIFINLKTQRGMLMNGSEVALDYPICSGIASRPTPPGKYNILEKVVDKKSNRYGKFVDAAGEVTNGNADVVLDPMPEGGHFEGAPMRYWMRLTWDGVGHHIGPVKGYPASHACIRGPSGTMPSVYAKVKVGTAVTVE
jgi:hypothetical protein